MSDAAEETEPDLTLGWRLRMAMEHAGMTALDIASEMEIDRTTVARWIHDETVPKRIYLRAWADRCGVSYTWLADEPAPKPAGRRAVPDNKTYTGRGRKPPRKGAETHSYPQKPWHRLPKVNLDLAPLKALEHSWWVAPASAR